tara:strand:+ start:282 stop:554 length:273 start_codon:yes stop_codon:yes gene_type:complete
MKYSKLKSTPVCIIPFELIKYGSIMIDNIDRNIEIANLSRSLNLKKFFTMNKGKINTDKLCIKIAVKNSTQEEDFLFSNLEYANNRTTVA